MTGHTAAAGLVVASQCRSVSTRGRSERCGQCASRSVALRPPEGPGFGGGATAMKIPGRVIELREIRLIFPQFCVKRIETSREIAGAAGRANHRKYLSCPHQALASLGGGRPPQPKRRTVT